MTRIVERGEKNKLRRRGRPRISEVPKVKELVEGSQDYEQNAYEVVEKMVKHIVRSYAYIYSEMSEKNKKETPIDWFID